MTMITRFALFTLITVPVLIHCSDDTKATRDKSRKLMRELDDMVKGDWLPNKRRPIAEDIILAQTLEKMIQDKTFSDAQADFSLAMPWSVPFSFLKAVASFELTFRHILYYGKVIVQNYKANAKNISVVDLADVNPDKGTCAVWVNVVTNDQQEHGVVYWYERSELRVLIRPSTFQIIEAPKNPHGYCEARYFDSDHYLKMGATKKTFPKWLFLKDSELFNSECVRKVIEHNVAVLQQHSVEKQLYSSHNSRGYISFVFNRAGYSVQADNALQLYDWIFTRAESVEAAWIPTHKPDHRREDSLYLIRNTDTKCVVTGKFSGYSYESVVLNEFTKDMSILDLLQLHKTICTLAFNFAYAGFK